MGSTQIRIKNKGPSGTSKWGQVHRYLILMSNGLLVRLLLLFQQTLRTKYHTLPHLILLSILQSRYVPLFCRQENWKSWQEEVFWLRVPEETGGCHIRPLGNSQFSTSYYKLKWFWTRWGKKDKVSLKICLFEVRKYDLRTRFSLSSNSVCTETLVDLVEKEVLYGNKLSLEECYNFLWK